MNFAALTPRTGNCSRRLSATTIGRVISKDRVRELVRRQFNEDFLQRHELDPFHTDTFEVIFQGGQDDLASDPDLLSLCEFMA